MVYVIEWTLAYDGLQQETFDTLEEVVDWIRGKLDRCGSLSLEDIKVSRSVDIDVFELMRRADEHLPLIIPYDIPRR